MLRERGVAAAIAMLLEKTFGGVGIEVLTGSCKKKVLMQDIRGQRLVGSPEKERNACV